MRNSRELSLDKFLPNIVFIYFTSGLKIVKTFELLNH